MLDGCTAWPQEAADRYRALGYWRGESLAELPQQWARRFGERTALVSGDRRISFARFAERTARMAAGFQRHGIAAGDRVVVQLPTTADFVLTVFALFGAGAKPVFALPSHRAEEIGHLCRLSGASGYVVPGQHQGFDHVRLAAETMADAPELRRVFVADGRIAEEVREAHGAGAFVPLAQADAEPSAGTPAHDPSDVAFFLLSGGTTALPKLIPRTHDDYVYQVRAAAEVAGIGKDDVYLAALPVGFNFTWGCPGVVGTLERGGSVVLMEDPVAVDCFEAVEEERATVTSLVPSMAQMWLETAEDAEFDLSSLRLVQIGGAPLHPATAQRVPAALGCRLQQVFGMAEGLLTLTRETDPPQTAATTQGRPLSPADEVRIVDGSGADVPAGTTGELLARGPYTLRGYYRAPEHNKRAFTEDGYYRTGDLARLTEDGNLVVEGRIKDVIIRGGNKVSADELEGHLLVHPAVERAAVVGVPDPYAGERICAYVRPAGEPPTLPQLREALRVRGIADYKLPDRLEIVDELPLTGLGKVDKKALAAAAAATEPTAT
ncbi:(2,3-dihydroxybenzoyl)adenylate synthase [Streptomonospora sediminis]